MIKLTMRILAVAVLFAVPQMASAQTPPPAQPAAAPAQQLLTAGQLDALVAPIALYPDALLSEILMAATYPLEVVEADRWASANKNLQGDALKAAIDKQNWDDSIKSLAATPDVLDMMSNKLDWTQQLGDAVLAQQPDVMDAIQRLRTKAQANNKLQSTSQQTVTTQQQDGRQYIYIAPTDPDELYVPYYDPSVVYGPWDYPDYPPYYWPPPAYIGVGILATGLAFGTGYALGRWASGGNRWGGGFNWGGRNINVNRSVNVGGNNWVHNPAHRGNVGYNNPGVAAKFGGNNARGGNQLNFRGSGGQQVLQPGGAGNRSNLGGGAGAGAGGNRTIGNGPTGNKSLGNAGANTRQTGGQNTRSRGNAGAGTGAGLNRMGGGGGGAVHARSVGGGGGGGGGAAVHARGGGGGGGAARGGGGAARGGGGAARGGGGARGRPSDIRLKHDIALLGRLDNGLGFYRFSYDGEDKVYVGVIAQEVQAVMPDAVSRGRDGYLRVYYQKLGVKFQTYDAWIASGAHLPVAAQVVH
ncbi:MAG TPA: DUF3300 domain-containing protein [Xanthobacteraceae bacterium]|nr:DUF3300 domain-containing protein [Xanthobacteraceae bacterium]